ncbi:phytanoyl-CoA dioxygenase family protein [Flavisolibacter tropicus]|uniref:Phytanoyl-CoA dioxygenase n=1 Tax=Flavisolibacter tropicus TaxID=1492898 RepID=A0A172U210_9BACT|nr:phytanoyl-CoA dioxygenase family protein [Flavisolibacter tropicus]ANE53063.1 hypothetical protein SY85_23890 [Flavisolibacter tropicus]
MDRNIFVSDTLQQQFVRDGFVKIACAEPELMAQVLQEFQALTPADGFDPDTNPVNPLNVSSYHCTFLDTDRTYKQHVQDIIARYIFPRFDAVLNNYEMLVGNFYVKPPGKGRFQIHQNWPVLDHEHTTLTIWMPLQDTTAENGTLHVIPGSHKVVPDIASPLCRPFFADFEDSLIQKHLLPIDVGVGEAVIFCDSLIHWSPQNNSTTSRVAIQIETYPAGHTPSLYILNSATGQFDVYPTSKNFFVDHSIDAVLQPPPGLHTSRSTPNPNREITYKRFLELLVKGPAIRERLYNGEWKPEETYIASDASSNQFTAGRILRGVNRRLKKMFS